MYPLSQGLSQKDMRKWQHQIRELCGRAKDAIPGELIEANRLCSMEYALQNIHFPEEKQKLLEAKYRLVFDELLILQTGLFCRAAEHQKWRRWDPYSEGSGYPTVSGRFFLMS